MNKGDIINSLPGSDGNIDMAVPQPWADKVREEGINPWMYAWDYRTSTVGEPLNLYERMVELLEEQVQDFVGEIISLRKENQKLKEKHKECLSAEYKLLSRLEDMNTVNQVRRTVDSRMREILEELEKQEQT